MTKLSREELLKKIESWRPRTLGVNWQIGNEDDEQAYSQIKSLLTPVPTDMLDEFVWHWIFKEIDFDYDDLIDMLKEYDNLREGKEG